MKHWFQRWFAIIVLCYLSFPASGQEAKAVAEAKQAATTWLSLLDRSDYAGTWQSAAEIFKGAISVSAWESAAAAARKPLGQQQSREIKSVTYTRSLPGAPPGEYVVIVYSSVFESQPAATETVTPMRDKDGAWRVSGYFVR